MTFFWSTCDNPNGMSNIKQFISVNINGIPRLETLIGGRVWPTHAHSSHSGLSADDHTQYMLNSAGIARQFTGDVYFQQDLRGTGRLRLDDNFRAGQGTWTQDGIDVSAGASEWSALYAAFGGHVSIIGALNTLSSGLFGLEEDQVLFGDTDGTVAQSSSLKYDPSTTQLTLGVAFPGATTLGDGVIAPTVGVGSGLYMHTNARIDSPTRSGSTWAASGVKLADDSGEWDAMETLGGGEVSLFALIAAAAAAGAIGGLEEDQVLLGGFSGGIEQSSSLQFDDVDLTISEDPDVDPTHVMTINWYQIFGGDNVTLDGEVDKIFAVGTNLTLNGSPNYLAVLGSGTVDADRSLIAGSVLDIGQGTGHTGAQADALLCLGTNLTVDADFGSAIGTVIDIDSSNFVSALGQHIDISHDYATARGNYVSTIWEGARHYALDQYDSDPGSAMGVDGLVLVGDQSGGGTCVLHTTFADTADYSFSIPDSRAVLISFDVMTSSVGTDASKNGLYARTGTALLWRNGGFFGWDNNSTVVVNRGGSDGDSWTTSVAFTHNPADPTDAVRVTMTVTGTCTTDLIHEMVIKSAIVMQTAYYKSS
ncbi:MAG: hypothetical protein P8Y00_00075 [Deltaproteobacteria bacterium]